MPSDPRLEKTSSSDDYNGVFERLVDDAGDGKSALVGLVAYGLYKSGKREWVLAHMARNGAPPSNDERAAYARTQTRAVLNGYTAQASEILLSYAGDLLKDERPRILKDALRGDFWRSFWPSLAASVAFAAILLILVGIAALQGSPLPIRFEF